MSLAVKDGASYVVLVVKTKNKKPPAVARDIRDTGSFLAWRRSPGEGHGNPLQYSCLENPHEQRSLAGYSPWGHKESDMTERLSTALTSSIRISSEEKFTT